MNDHDSAENGKFHDFKNPYVTDETKRIIEENRQYHWRCKRLELAASIFAQYVVNPDTCPNDDAMWALKHAEVLMLANATMPVPNNAQGVGNG